ncbi:MAG: response regulator [Clostridium sp.]|nr:response regulator [Clostridium sp.]
MKQKRLRRLKRRGRERRKGLISSEMLRTTREQNRDTVLIIEDTEINRVTLRQMLEKEYQIVESGNGLEGIQYMEEHPDEIALILLNIGLFLMDGCRIVEYMQQGGYLQTLPVILIMGDEDDEAIERSYALGAADVIRTPFQENIIRQRVHNMIELSEHKNHMAELDRVLTAELNRQHEKLQRHNENVIKILRDMITLRDTESDLHIRYIEGYTRILARQYAALYPRSKMTNQKIEYIVQAAGMHDLGKITISDFLISQQGRLLPEEIEYMKQHTVKGSDIIKVMLEFEEGLFYRISYNVCRYHHERYDGTGYPEGLSGDKIPVEAQLVSLADMYDALVNVAVNKERYPADRAVRMLLEGTCGELAPRMKECLMAAKQELEEFVL